MTVDDLTNAVSDERDRYAAMSEVELGPESLVGSYFHKLEEGRIALQGLVVAEPAPGVYLLAVRDTIYGASRAQILVRIEHMVPAADENVPAYRGDLASEWRFYDSEAAMNEAYAEWITANTTEPA